MGGEYQDFPSKIFCLTQTKISVGGTLQSFVIFRYRKSLCKRGGEYQNFPSKVICLTMPKYFEGEPFCAVFQKVAGSEKIYR